MPQSKSLFLKAMSLQEKDQLKEWLATYKKLNYAINQLVRDRVQLNKKRDRLIAMYSLAIKKTAVNKKMAQQKIIIKQEIKEVTQAIQDTIVQQTIKTEELKVVTAQTDQLRMKVLTSLKSNQSKPKNFLKLFDEKHGRKSKENARIHLHELHEEYSRLQRKMNDRRYHAKEESKNNETLVGKHEHNEESKVLLQRFSYLKENNLNKINNKNKSGALLRHSSDIVQDLIKCESVYLSLGRKTHIDSFKNLFNKIENLIQKSPPNLDNFIINKIEHILIDKRDEFKSKEAFVNKLKTNTNEFYFYRLLSLVLQRVYSNAEKNYIFNNNLKETISNINTSDIDLDKDQLSVKLK